MLRCIKGVSYTVIRDNLKNFKPGDVVIALEDDTCPYCCLEKNYKPGIPPLSSEYSCGEVHTMAEEELEGPKEEYEEIIQDMIEVNDIVD